MSSLVSCVAAKVGTRCDPERSVLHHSTVGEQELSEMRRVFAGHFVQLLLPVPVPEVSGLLSLSHCLMWRRRRQRRF